MNCDTPKEYNTHIHTQEESFCVLVEDLQNTLSKKVQGAEHLQSGVILIQAERKNMYLYVKIDQSCPTFVTPWTIQCMEFSRPEYWSRG